VVVVIVLFDVVLLILFKTLDSKTKFEVPFDRLLARVVILEAEGDAEVPFDRLLGLKS
jgi:hypothetical protein